MCLPIDLRGTRRSVTRRRSFAILVSRGGCIDVTHLLVALTRVGHIAVSYIGPLTDASYLRAETTSGDATTCTNVCSEMLSALSPQDLAVVQLPTAGDLREGHTESLEGFKELTNGLFAQEYAAKFLVARY